MVIVYYIIELEKDRGINDYQEYGFFGFSICKK